MADVYDRILELEVTADESADTFEVTAVNYYRDRGHLEDSDPKLINFTAGSAAANHEVELGEVIPPPSIIRLASTFQA